MKDSGWSCGEARHLCCTRCWTCCSCVSTYKTSIDNNLIILFLQVLLTLSLSTREAVQEKQADGLLSVDITKDLVPKILGPDADFHMC